MLRSRPSRTCRSNESDDVNDYTSTTPPLIKILGETHDVDSWANALTVAIAAVSRDLDNHEQSKQVSGLKRNHFTEEGQQSELVTPRKILDTGLYLKTNFLPDTIVRINERVL